MAERWVTLIGYGTLVEAQLVCGRLVAAGIPAWVPDQESSGIVGEFIGGTSGIRVQVPESRLAEAHSVLESSDASSELVDDERGAEPERPLDPRRHSPPPALELVRCPACGTRIPGRSRAGRDRWLRLGRALTGRRHRCSGCRRDLRDFV